MTCAGSVWGGRGAAVWQGGLSGSPGSCAAQRGALWRYDWPTVAQKQKSPPPASTGGGPGRKGRLMLLVEAIAALAALALEGFYLVTGLLHRAGHKSTNGVSLPFHRLHDLRNGGPAFALEHGDYLGHLAALARPATFLRLGGLLGFGRGLGRGGLLGRLALAGRALGGLCATLGLLVGLRLRGRRRGLRGVPESLD